MWALRSLRSSTTGLSSSLFGSRLTTNAKIVVFGRLHRAER
jgi:hypothetical protein